MNPLTNIRNIKKLNEREIELGIDEKNSWHQQYSDSAWIYIGGLPYDLTEGDVICVFSQYGEVVNINLTRDPKTGKSKGHCFLCYEDQKSTNLAVDNLNGIMLLKRTLRVDHMKEYKPPKDNDDIDEVTRKLHDEGVAPRTPSPTPPPAAPEPPTQHKVKKEKKKRKKVKKEKDSEESSEEERSPKKKKSKKKKKKKEVSSESEESAESDSEEERKRKKKKKQKKKRKRRHSSSSESESSGEESEHNSSDSEERSHRHKKKKRHHHETSSSAEESVSDHVSATPSPRRKERRSKDRRGSVTGSGGAPPRRDHAPAPRSSYRNGAHQRDEYANGRGEMPHGLQSYRHRGDRGAHGHGRPPPQHSRSIPERPLVSPERERHLLAVSGVLDRNRRAPESLDQLREEVESLRELVHATGGEAPPPALLHSPPLEKRHGVSPEWRNRGPPPQLRLQRRRPPMGGPPRGRPRRPMQPPFARMRPPTDRRGSPPVIERDRPRMRPHPDERERHRPGAGRAPKDERSPEHVPERYDRTSGERRERLHEPDKKDKPAASSRSGTKHKEKHQR